MPPVVRNSRLPTDPIRLVFDSQPLDYSDPFLLHKSTHRKLYDDARLRHGSSSPAPSSLADPQAGATLHASPPPSAPFDVILFNTSHELTESTIANVAFRLDKSVSEEWITPSTSCGLLAGVQRAEMLERGEVVEGVVRLEEARRAVEVSLKMRRVERANVGAGGDARDLVL